MNNPKLREIIQKTFADLPSHDPSQPTVGVWDRLVPELEAAINQLIGEERINELTRLDNAHDEITADNFHKYYINRIKQLKEKYERQAKNNRPHTN